MKYKWIVGAWVVLLAVGSFALMGALTVRARPVAPPTRANGSIIVNSVADPGDGVCDDRECTLREGIAAAAPGDLVTLGLPLGALIRLQRGQLVIDKNLTLTAPALIARITVDGNSRGRVLRIDAGAEVEIRGLRITGGNSEFESSEKAGGGIWNRGHLTLVDVLVEQNRAKIGPSEDMLGGGIFNQGVLLMQSSVLHRNVAFEGGGLMNVGEALVQGSEISANGTDSYGAAGGISNAGSLVLSNSVILQNHAAFVGGGIANRGSLLMRKSIVRENTVWGVPQGIVGYGGGIYNQGTAQLVETAVVGNGAEGYGGGIHNEGSARLVKSAVVSNGASIKGAGIWNAAEAEMVVTMSTIGRNRVNPGWYDRVGGGLGNNGQLTLSCSTVAENSPEGVNTFGGRTIVGGSIIAGNDEWDCQGNPDDIAWLSFGGNLLGDGPCPAEPGDVSIDSTQVFSTTLYPLPESPSPDPAALVYALRPGSAAIDAGLNCVGSEGDLLTQDQRGVPRPLDGDGDGGLSPDSGPYEFNPQETPIPTPTPTLTPAPNLIPLWLPLLLE